MWWYVWILLCSFSFVYFVLYLLILCSYLSKDDSHTPNHQHAHKRTETRLMDGYTAAQFRRAMAVTWLSITTTSDNCWQCVLVLVCFSISSLVCSVIFLVCCHTFSDSVILTPLSLLTLRTHPPVVAALSSTLLSFLDSYPTPTEQRNVDSNNTNKSRVNPVLLLCGE